METDVSRNMSAIARYDSFGRLKTSPDLNAAFEPAFDGGPGPPVPLSLSR